MKTNLMLAGLLLTGCDGGTDSGTTGEAVTMEVSSLPAMCSGEGQWICPTVQIDGGDWGTLACGVSGLDHEWGTTYTITAAYAGNDDTMADGCGDRYDLVSVEASSFVGEEPFTLSWVYDIYITVDGSSGSVGTLAFVCEDDTVCEAAAAILSLIHI